MGPPLVGDWGDLSPDEACVGKRAQIWIWGGVVGAWPFDLDHSEFQSWLGHLLAGWFMGDHHPTCETEVIPLERKSAQNKAGLQQSFPSSLRFCSACPPDPLFCSGLRTELEG